ncbi:MAG TPA: hypothetical protein VH188_03565, partial [Chthoniobacterales bacterium]|nr:hypothetical protein [Chthoniobacterales bacterium]
MGSGNPFTILEAEIAFTFGSDPIVPLWAGGCAEEISLNDEYKEQTLEYPGLPNSGVKHVDETHLIDIGNLWLANLDGSVPVMPNVVRNQVYTLVIVWFDEETGYFAKRTYYEVTARSQRVRTPNQSLSYRAALMIDLAGFAERPDL